MVRKGRQNRAASVSRVSDIDGSDGIDGIDIGDTQTPQRIATKLRGRGGQTKLPSPGGRGVGGEVNPSTGVALNTSDHRRLEYKARFRQTPTPGNRPLQDGIA